MSFYDETPSRRLSKGIRNLGRERIPELLSHADQLYSAVPPDHWDVDASKADVMARRHLRARISSALLRPGEEKADLS